MSAVLSFAHLLHRIEFPALQHLNTPNLAESPLSQHEMKLKVGLTQLAIIDTLFIY